jgi:hypothetical protein
MTQVLGMEPDSQLSPALLRKVVHAGASSSSFRQAAEDLQVLAEVTISSQRVRRASERVGQQRVEQSRSAAQAYGRLPLPDRWRSPGSCAPQVACIQTDGGRIQIRPRKTDSAQPRGSEHWWRETKVGCLLEMTSAPQAQDPTPTIPQVFVDPGRMAQIAREIKGFCGDEGAAPSPPELTDQASRDAPRILAQTVVASRENVEQFGERLAAAAYMQGFAAAERKAFVADGSETNWGLWRRHFSHYTPILDWVHALCYVYAAAMAGVDAPAGWAAYRDWAQWLWSGQIDYLLEQLDRRQAQLGLPDENDADTSPKQRVADARRYLDNQRTRMNYPEYRRQGLPITSSHVESTIKRINRRMKGSEKFWDQGAESLLQLVADHLGPPHQLQQFWTTRPQTLCSQRHYQPT